VLGVRVEARVERSEIVSAVAATRMALLHPVRFVGYVDEALREVLPVALARPWVAEEACEPLNSRLGRLGTTPGGEVEAQRLRAGARKLADGALGLLRREILPPCDLLSCTRADPLGGLEIIGTSEAGKVRIDEDLAVALVRRKPFSAPPGTPRLDALRLELRATLALSLEGVPARKAVEHDEIDPRGIAVELEPPAGGGFQAGRGDALYVYSNQKVLLLALRPARFMPDCYEPPHARGALGALHGRANGLPSVGLVADDLAPEAWNDVPAELRYRKDAS
jgi:hypothetical protein